MKLVKVGLATLLLGFGSVASAAYVDTIVDVQHVVAGETISNTHDITDDGFVPIFTPVHNAVLTIAVTDDYDRADGFAWDPRNGLYWADREEEWAQVGVGFLDINLGSFEIDFLDTQTYSFTWNNWLGAAVLLDIWWDGQLSYSLTGTSGDFYFLGSQLAVNVPEPASLALLGLGLAGLGFARRRKTC